MIITFPVDDDGKNLKGIATLKHDTQTSNASELDFIKIDNDSYALADLGPTIIAAPIDGTV